MLISFLNLKLYCCEIGTLSDFFYAVIFYHMKLVCINIPSCQSNTLPSALSIYLWLLIFIHVNCCYNNLFNCVAYEVLGVPEKRRAYDSIDTFFDDRIPNITKDEKKFYNLFGPVFKSNAR